ncbi:YaeQ family protein [Cupriavidus basilensis]
MALKSTIYKAELSVSDMDRPYYGSHALTIAKHPSENDARMMDAAAGLCLRSQRDVDLHPRPGRARRAGPVGKDPDRRDRALDRTGPAGRVAPEARRRAADRVTVFTYNGASAREWWKGMAGKAGKLRNVTIYNVPAEAVEALAALAQRAMRLSVTIQDSEIWVSDDDHNVRITLEVLQQPQG